MTGSLSVGIAAAAGTAVAEAIGPALERGGFHALWVNDTPGADALEVLAAAARVTDRLVLATGVIPVDRRAPHEILTRVETLGLPLDRLVLGIGAGGIRVGALDRVRDAAVSLRAGTTARVVVGALGPKMRRLGVEAADGLLLSWLTPDMAAEQAAHAHGVDPATHVALYVRAATDPEAASRLHEEAARYGSYPAYAANFAHLGITAAETIIEPGAGPARIDAYRAGVDEVVLRAITTGDLPEDYIRFIDAVTP